MISLLVLTGCLPEPFSLDDDDRVKSLDFTTVELPPGTHPVVDDPEVAAVGALLFTDTTLSADGNTSCLTCHDLCFGTDCTDPYDPDPCDPADTACPDPELDPLSAADRGVALSKGSGGVLGRSTPTLRETAYRPRWGWAGQYCSLAEQSLAPLKKTAVFGHPEAPPTAAPEAVQAAVRARFTPETWPAALGSLEADDLFDQVGLAFEAFLRTLPPTTTKLDRAFDEGVDVFTPTELRGLELFVGKASCIDCHVGVLMSDDQLHVTSVPDDDLGVAAPGAAWCHGDFDPDTPPDGAFLTPPLRNLTLTGPYMHDGSLQTLDDVVWHYNEGGSLPPDAVGTPDPRFQPLSLDAGERADLRAFLATLGPS